MTTKAPGRSKKNTSNAGFEEAFETHGGMGLGEDNDLQAWCDACEAIRQEEGGWNDLSQDIVEIKIVCEKCYFNIKELNLYWSLLVLTISKE